VFSRQGKVLAAKEGGENVFFLQLKCNLTSDKKQWSADRYQSAVVAVAEETFRYFTTGRKYTILQLAKFF
jgi:hypothetical protein